MSRHRCESLAVLSVAALLMAADPAAASGGFCANKQSPRDVLAFDAQSGESIVELTGDPAKVIYSPRDGGDPQPLYRCGQHYHFPIENHQWCVGEVTGEHRQSVRPGDVVEVHTVYASKVNRDRCTGAEAAGCCDPQTLDCCLEPPFLVRAFSATVTREGGPGPIEVPAGRPLAEWSGSSTGSEKWRGECKVAAEWSFRLGCGFELSEAQLRPFTPQEARQLQTGPRISCDLTLVTD